MNVWLLTAEEGREALRNVKYPSLDKAISLGVEELLAISDASNMAVAQAQLRKVIEVISRRSDECSAAFGILLAHGVNELTFMPVSGKAWNELKKEAGLDH